MACLRVIAAFCLSLFYVPVLNADPVEGYWLTEKNDAIVAIHVQEEGLEGQIVWLLEPRHPDGHERAGQVLRDVENPEPALRDRPILGLVILSGFERHREGQWRDGEVYDPENGRTYRARLTLEDEGNTLKLRGYVGTPLFGRSSRWQRVEGQLPSDRGQSLDQDSKAE